MLGGTALVAFTDGTWIVKNNGRAEPPDPLLAEHTGHILGERDIVTFRVRGNFHFFDGENSKTTNRATNALGSPPCIKMCANLPSSRFDIV